MREYGFGRAGTATAATGTTLVDASHFGGNVPGGAFPNGSPVRITSGAAAGGNAYKSGLDPSTGTITLNATVTNLNGTTPTFIISNVVEHCDRLVEAINRCLTRKFSRWLKVGLTDVPDGDFMGTTITDHWAVTTAAQAYTTLTMTNGVSQRCLQVTTSSPNGYTQSDAISVEPGETRQGMVWMRNGAAATVTATAQVIIINAATNAVITPTFSIGSATTTSHSFVVVRYTYTVPAGCTQIAYRLAGQENGAVVQFTNVLDGADNQRVFTAQPHLQTDSDIGQFYVYSPDGDSISGPEDGQYLPISDDGITYNDFGWGIGLDFQSSPGWPLFYEELTFFPALASDSDTTDATEEVVLLGAAIEVTKMLVSQSGERPTISRGKVLPTFWERKLQEYEARWRSAQNQRFLAERVVRIKRNYAARVYA